jgi:hypothetical protein
MSQAVLARGRQRLAAREHERWTLTTALLWIQGPYYLLTGVWPLISIRTFQLVTGPKTDHLPTGREADHWLVMTVGVLVMSIAITLLVAAWWRSAPLEVAILALASAVGLTSIDVIYVTRQVIDPIYLVDAVIEVPLIIGWIAVLVQQARSRKGEA